MKVIMASEPFDDRIGVLMFYQLDNRREVLTYPPAVIKDVYEGDRIEQPTLSLRRDEIQALVDAAAKIGIHPTVPLAPASELAAVKYHLEDMRRLAFWSVAQ